MKQYKYVEMTHKLLGGYVSKKYDNASPREVIDMFAENGWRFVSMVPKLSDGYGRITVYDLVFEKDAD